MMTKNSRKILKKITKIRRKQEARWPGGPSEPTREQFSII
jgi:hypothetical protein